MSFILWLVVGVMTAVVLGFLVRPLLRTPSAGATREAYDMQVYRDQLHELDTDLERGLITPQQQAAARTEIERRMLSIADAARTPRMSRDSRVWRFAGVVAVVALVPIGGILTYQFLGSPDLPDQPLAQRLAPGGGTDAPGDMQMDAAIQRLAERLKENPNDLQGWTLLGRSYAVIGRYQEAVSAYREALALAPDNIDVAASLGEMIVLSAEGMVTPAARRTFEEIATKAPEEPTAQYYLALAALQAGHPQEAFDRWKAMAEGAPGDAPWLPAVRDRLTEVAATLGVEPPDIDVAAPAERPAGPSAEDMAAAEDMSADERSTMIRSMVERLAGRLEENPDDFEGWMRLGNAYSVLEESEKSRDAYRKAVALRPEDTEALSALAQAEIRTVGTDEAPPPEAIDAYRRVLAQAPNRAEALWFVAQAEADAGNTEEASELLQRLLPQLPPDSDPYRTVADLIARLGGAIPSTTEPEDAAPAVAPADEDETSSLVPMDRPPPPMPGPSQADVAAAANMSPDDRMTMIRGMVERLAQRLESDPGDLAGWLRLANAYQVLGETDKARSAYESALEQDPRSATALAGYASLLIGAGTVPGERLADYRQEVSDEGAGPDALWFVGVAEAEAGRPDQAVALWNRLLDRLPADSEAHAALSARIAALDE